MAYIDIYNTDKKHSIIHVDGWDCWGDEALASRIVERSKEYLINIGKDVKKNYRLKGIV